MTLIRIASVISFASGTFAFAPCPILGPVFEPPSSLCTAEIFQSGLHNLTTSLDEAIKSSQTPFGPIVSNWTSFSIGIFNATDTLFSYQYSSPTLQKGTEGVKEVTEDSIYRVGSGSKLFTAYLFLIEAGAEYWNRAITEFLPELEEASKNCSAREDAINCIDWNEVTLGAMASHMAGLPRDYSTPSDLSVSGLPVTEYGLPPLPVSEIPTCETNFTNPCSEYAYLRGLSSEHPVYKPYTAPIYSNAGYEVLGMALEKITNRTFADMLEKDFFGPLGMTHSSYNTPHDLSDAVLPLGPELSGFIAEEGYETAAGGYYSTQSDYVKMGQSILQASLLSADSIRQWMKPVAFPSNMNEAVGMPWEILRIPNLVDHTFDLYGKSGDVFSYSSMFALARDWEVGFVILAAGNDTTVAVAALSDVLTHTIFPALEDTARSQAHKKFAGTYVSSEAGVNSSITLTTLPGEPALVVESWISNGTDFKAVIADFESAADGVDIRLYPSLLDQMTSEQAELLGYRAVIEAISSSPPSALFSTNCISWFTVDSLNYGGVGIDEFEFEVKDGAVVSVSPRALRISLEKKA